jgi:hypothetical protein
MFRTQRHPLLSGVIADNALVNQQHIQGTTRSGLPFASRLHLKERS